MAKSGGKLDDHAMAIGYVCMAWARLEAEGQLLLQKLLFRQRPHSIWHPAIHVFGFRDVIAATRIAGFEGKPNDKWFTELDDHLNFVDNVLRNERNKFVHNLWMDGEKEAIRLSLRRTVKKTKDGHISLSRPSLDRFSPEDSFLLETEIIAEAAFSRLLLQQSTRRGFSLEKLLAKRPPRRLLLLQKEKQRQTDKARARPKSPPQPSQA